MSDSKSVVGLFGEDKIPHKLHPYQSQAVSVLDAYYRDEAMPADLGWKPYLLVMPTGSGKTFTASSLIVPSILEKSKKLLWLTHRQLLLEQAATEIKGFYPDKDGDEKKVMRIVSGINTPLSNCSFKDDSAIICSIQSLYSGVDRLDFILRDVKGSELLVVIDEAHHTPMTSYRHILDKIKSLCPGFNLLGLTATPTRLAESERKMLYHIYNKKLLQPVSLSHLISQGYLSKPKFDRIETRLEVEQFFNDADTRHLQRFGELSEKIKTQIANAKERNHKIIDTYVENKEKYGKTIIFSINQIHCETLCRDLQAKGVKADFVLSGTPQKNKEVIEKFRKNEFDVLVNVEIMTEGVDVPDTKTVFMTRPTKSDSLMMQMIGRALRGPKMGGTEEAYIVDFVDFWDRFPLWLNPEFIVDAEFIEIDPKKSTPTVVQGIPWDVINAIYDSIRMNITLFNRGLLNMQPLGWYSIGAIGTDTENKRVFVWENQKSAFDKMAENLHVLKESGYDATSAKNDFFSDINDPLPQEKDIESVIEVVKKLGKMPEYFTFEERDLLAPDSFAKEIYVKDMGEKSKTEYLTNEYKDKNILRQVYSDYTDFRDCVQTLLNRMSANPTTTKDYTEQNPVVATKQETTKLLKEAKPYPKEFINKIYNEVVDKMFLGDAIKPESINWSEDVLKNAWGFYRISDRRIVLNRALDNQDIPEDVVKYVLYHEMLHCQGHLSHNNEFRAHEHKYPNWQEMEYKLNKIIETNGLEIPQFDSNQV